MLLGLEAPLVWPFSGGGFWIPTLLASTNQTTLNVDSDKTEFVFIDSTISDLDNFISNLRPEVEANVLGCSSPATVQIAEALKNRAGIKAIHVVAHGRAGEVQFAAGTLTTDTLNQYSTELSYIGAALAPDGDLLVWSCNTAQGKNGKTFIESLARMTGANVAGATGLVGSLVFGGEWVIESARHSPSPLTPDGIRLYAGVMAVTQAKLTKITTDSGTVGDFFTNDNTLIFNGTDLDSGISSARNLDVGRELYFTDTYRFSGSQC